jgi:hypothetical protein
MTPSRTKLGVIRGDDEPSGPDDPLAEAFKLAEQARTPRERLRAAEQIRGATKLRLRRIDPEAEDRKLLDANVLQARDLYVESPDFETRARALAGWRESILQRLDAVQEAESIEVPPVIIGLHDGTILGTGRTPLQVAPDQYWRGVPRQFRDMERYIVTRKIRLHFGGGGKSDEEVKVYDGNSVLVWTNGTRSS